MIIREARHAHLTRDGDDLRWTCHLSRAQAERGGVRVARLPLLGLHQSVTFATWEPGFTLHGVPVPVNASGHSIVMNESERRFIGLGMPRRLRLRQTQRRQRHQHLHQHPLSAHAVANSDNDDDGHQQQHGDLIVKLSIA